MSSKTKTTTTKEEAKPALVPKLRFPEFRDNWLLIPLGKCFTNIGGTALEKYITEGTRHHFISIGNYSPDGKYLDKGQRVEANDITKTKQLSKNDLVMVLNDKTLAGDIIGSTLLIDEDDKYIYNQRSERLIVGNQFTPIFAWYLLNSKNVRQEVFKRSQGGTQIYVNFPTLKTITLCVPKESNEQQKIAECLSSLDELMAAQARKVDALKTHKKGLMQQLFPREGETQPRLRFPEFQNAGEWARMSIQEMIDQQFIVGHLDGNHGELYPKAEELSHNKEGIPYITANDFMNGSVEFSRCKRLPIERARLFKKGVAKDGDILFAHNATVGPVAKLNTSEEFVILSTTATYFRCNAKHLSNDFLKAALSSPDFVAQYSRVMSQSTRNQVPITTQRKLELHVPKPPEQQRIATCLSSLDTLITAETQKLEALKTHKKGLMQQLFPTPEEVEA